jgi:sarcosine oxidase subunit beta
MSDVLVIGGGVNGASIAYNLAKLGEHVTLIEKNYMTSGATGKCGGGIRTQFTTEETCRVVLESSKLFDSLSKELDCDIELRKGGYLILAHSEAELEDFKSNVRMQNSVGVPSRILGLGEIEAFGVEPYDAVGASFCDMDGVANPFRVTFGYRDRARELGVNARNHEEVRKISYEREKFRVLTSKDTYEADFVVNAAGYDSKGIAQMLGVSLPLEPYKHEILATEAMDHFLDPMLMSFAKNFYMSQTVRGELVGGYSPHETRPTEDLTSTFSFAVGVKKLIEKHLPQIRSLKLLRQWAGYYDMTPDALPIMGPAGYERFIQANGFSGHGFMLSPFVGEAIASMIAGSNRYEAFLSPFSFERFKRGVKRERAVVG